MIKTEADEPVGGGSGNVQRFLRRAAVESATGLPRSTIYELIGRGTFPKPVRLSPRLVGWLESEIADWQRRCIAERDTGKAA